MELLIKIYRDQPVRLGIKYKYGFQAKGAYEELIRKYRGQSFTMDAEALPGKINLSLNASESGGRVVYKDLAYRPEQLRSLLAGLTPETRMQFVHVYSESNALLVAKPFKLNEFFSISSIAMVGGHNFE